MRYVNLRKKKPTHILGMTNFAGKPTSFCFLIHVPRTPDLGKNVYCLRRGKRDKWLKHFESVCVDKNGEVVLMMLRVVY